MGVRPGGQILQGTLIILIGIGLILANLNYMGQIKKITGVVQNEYTHSHQDAQTGDNFAYDATYLAVSTNNELFIFNKYDLHPAWDDAQVFKGEKVDVYYGDETPQKVFAIQFYSIMGSLSQKFTTNNFDTNPNTYPKSDISSQAQIWITEFGLFLICLGMLLIIRHKRRTSKPAYESPSYAAIEPRKLYASPPPKYVPPSRQNLMGDGEK